MKKIPIPQEIINMVRQSEKLKSEIQKLKSKPKLSLSDLKDLANLKAELLRHCPPERFFWSEGKPAVDILKELTKIQSLH